MTAITILHEAKRLAAIADVGLLYATNPYDRERYLEMKQIALLFFANASGHSINSLMQSFPLLPDYPTAKVDIRGLVLSPDKKILLVKESADGCWSLPGGWADIGYSPSETVIKEVNEETGLQVNVKQLLAVFDKRKHDHPPQAEYVYKLVFYCEAITKEMTKGFDVLDVEYFAIDALPPLSENRILQSQIELVYQRVMEENPEAYFD